MVGASGPSNDNSGENREQRYHSGIKVLPLFRYRHFQIQSVIQQQISAARGPNFRTRVSIFLSYFVYFDSGLLASGQNFNAFCHRQLNQQETTFRV